MDYVEKTVSKQYLYKGKILTVRKDDALTADGKPCVREIIEHSGGACVLYVENGSVLLVRQYRYAYGESIYEIPAGKLDGAEDPKMAAARELEEEAGLKAGRLEHLFTIYPTPGYTNEKIYLYRAYDCQKTKAHLDEGEFLDVEYVPLEKAKEMLQNGQIKDGKTIIALQAYLLSDKA